MKTYSYVDVLFLICYICKGMFKGKERKQSQEQMKHLQTQIENMKRYLPAIVQEYGYKNVKKEFLTEYKASKAEYGDYRKAVTEWEKLTGEKLDDSFKAKLQQKQQQVKEQNSRNEYQRKYDKGLFTIYIYVFFFPHKQKIL